VLRWIAGCLDERLSHGAPQDAATGNIKMREIRAPTPLPAVRAVIDQMSDAQRAAIQLVCYEQLSYEEAASRLGVPVTVLKQDLLSARRLLITMLQ
jgi:DNA-directed RNA polymerase specialized sigma24 family protein